MLSHAKALLSTMLACAHISLLLTIQMIEKINDDDIRADNHHIPPPNSHHDVRNGCYDDCHNSVVENCVGKNWSEDKIDDNLHVVEAALVDIHRHAAADDKNDLPMAIDGSLEDRSDDDNVEPVSDVLDDWNCRQVPLAFVCSPLPTGEFRFAS